MAREEGEEEIAVVMCNHIVSEPNGSCLLV